MTLVACTCPHCGGEVRMDDSLTSGFCTYCGRRIINDNAVVGRVDVRMDRSGEVVNILKLAKYSMYDGDASGAAALLSRAMQMDPDNSDVWYMDAVIDRRNAETDIERASNLPSLGVFTREDVDLYRNFDNTLGQPLLLVSVIFTFFATFLSIPFSIIFEMYWLSPTILGIGSVFVILSYLHMRMCRRTIPAPVFGEEESIKNNLSGMHDRE